MRYIVAVDRKGIHVHPVRDISSPYHHMHLVAEKSVYTYGAEYVAVVHAETPERAQVAGLQIIRKHFPEALPEVEETIDHETT
jgi:hypothetical protein